MLFRSVEPGPAGADNARAGRGIENVICATLENAGFATASVAAVGLFDVLEHIEDDRAMVGQLRDALRPGGLVYLTVPSPPWLYSIKDVDAQHFRRYSLRGLRDVFGAAFEVLYATYFFSALTLPTFLLRALPYRLGLAKPQSSGRYAAELSLGGGLTRATMERLFERERVMIRGGRVRFYGTSCLMAARRRI